MRWHYLGHAMWLLELGSEGTRVLFDPLLHDVHDDGLSRVVPARDLRRDLLRPDFIVVSHRHPDHFDVDSLAWLAARDPECVVLTADQLVADVCERLGFLQVRVLQVWEQVELLGGTLTTTPSFGSSVEWGVLVSNPDGVVWNHIDSVLGTAQQAERTLEVLRGVAGQGVHLHLARWCPVLEVAAQLGGRVGFPRGTYLELLRGLAALLKEPSWVAPAAVSVVPHAPHDGLARNAFPVTWSQFTRDLSTLAPNARLSELEVGDVLSLANGVMGRAAGASPLVSPVGAPELPRFVPFEIAELTDPWPPATEADPDEQIRDWLENALCPRLAELSRAAPQALPLTLCLELRGGNNPYGTVGQSATGPSSAWTVRLSQVGDRRSSLEGRSSAESEAREGADGRVVWRLEPGVDPSYDQLVAVSRGGLLRVLGGRSSWGELLLSGQLRCSDRAFRVTGEALERVPWLPALFVYATPGYEESFETATWRRVDAARRNSPV